MLHIVATGERAELPEIIMIYTLPLEMAGTIAACARMLFGDRPVITKMTTLGGGFLRSAPSSPTPQLLSLNAQYLRQPSLSFWRI
jgi:hypothetical protein